MDPRIHRGETDAAAAYARFAEREARGTSETYERWASGVAGDPEVAALIAGLPGGKRQPNLVFAAARHHGAPQGPYAALREVLLSDWPAIRATIGARATQTNEPGRCAVLLPLLAALPQPIALLEVGASAGLCLLPDRYSYRYRRSGEVTRIDPPQGPSPVVLDCDVRGDGPQPRRVEIAWRRGLDTAPVDLRDPDALAWLTTLVWPEHEERRRRLSAAADLARVDPPLVVAGDLRTDLPALAAQAPREATLVVVHTAVLAYVADEDRRRFVERVGALPGHWISYEGASVLPFEPAPPARPQAPGDFVVALDGRPAAFAAPHGQAIEWIAGAGALSPGRPR